MNSSATASKESSSLSSQWRQSLSSTAPLSLPGREVFTDPSPMKLAGQAAAYLPSANYGSGLHASYSSYREEPRSAAPPHEHHADSGGGGNVSKDANIQATLGHIAGQVGQGCLLVYPPLR